MKNFILLFIIHELIFPIYLNEIKILGNKNTHNQIILREIKHPIPGILDTNIKINDQNRLKNLGIFKNVKISEIDSTYLITVVEKNQYSIIPLIDYKKKYGWRYGFDFIHLNFMGKNETIIMGLMVGNLLSYNLEYIKPNLINGTSNSSFLIDNKNINHHVYPVITNFLKISTITKINSNQKQKIIELGYENVISKIDSNHINLQKIDEINLYGDSYLKTKIQYKNIISPYIKNFKLELINNWSKYKKKAYHTFSFNFEYQYNLKNQIFNPTATFTNISIIQFSNELPYYRKLYLGGIEYVRGYSPFPNQNGIYKKNIEVDNIVCNSFELQFSIFEKFNLNGILFFDHGLGWMIDSNPQLSSNILGTGLGFRISLLPGSKIGFDIGINPKGQIHFYFSSMN